jgi:uncharacterized membrane-anchored protein YhcB (DUF1043 family)
MDAQWLEAIATALSALAAGGSVCAVLYVWGGQKRLAAEANDVQERLSKEQRDLQQRLERQQEKVQNDLAERTAELQRDVAREQNKLQRDLADKTGELQRDLAREQDKLQKDLADKDQLSQRRSALVGLWPYLIDIHHIDPEQSAAEQVRQAVNTLELVALCWEANIIDKDVIQRTFESTYIEIYEQVLSVRRKLPSLDKTGRELLNENPAAINLYEYLNRSLHL